MNMKFWSVHMVIHTYRSFISEENAQHSQIIDGIPAVKAIVSASEGGGQ